MENQMDKNQTMKMQAGKLRGFRYVHYETLVSSSVAVIPGYRVLPCELQSVIPI